MYTVKTYEGYAYQIFVSDASCDGQDVNVSDLDLYF